MMNILHIACVVDSKFDGVCVVVPQHIVAQQKIEDVAFLNISNVKMTGVEKQFDYSDKLQISSLPEPFNHPDIVVFHQTYIVPYLRLSTELRKKGIPYVIVPHGDLTAGAQHKKWLKKKVANLLLFNRFINGAVAIQNLSQLELNSTVWENQRFIGTNGISIPNRQKESFRINDIKFVYIGRLDAYHKGLDLFVEAVATEKAFFMEHNCSFHIYGPDKNGRYANIERLIRENEVETLIHLSHEVSGEEKEQILLDADVFIQTSRFEGLPMGILEALGYGLPCLISRGTCLGEITEKYDAGWVAENNVDSIVEKMMQVVTERKQLKVKSKNARRLVEENFAWDKVAARIVECYREFAVNDR